MGFKKLVLSVVVFLETCIVNSRFQVCAKVGSTTHEHLLYVSLWYYP